MSNIIVYIFTFFILTICSSSNSQSDVPTTVESVNELLISLNLIPVKPDEFIYCQAPGICVDASHCNPNNTVNKYGGGLIQERFGQDSEHKAINIATENLFNLTNRNTLDNRTTCHYLEVCCNGTKQNVETPSSIGSKGCGFRNPNGLKITIKTPNNNEAQYGEFPWMVAIIENAVPKSNNANFICGGSLIHPQVVLTAAHCVSSKTKESITIRAGEWDKQTDREFWPYQEQNVLKVIIHENFDRRGLLNDIALVVLNEPFMLVESIQTICLATKNLIFDGETDCFASGWGKEIFGKDNPSPAILKKRQLPVIATDVCQSKLRTTKLGPFFEVHESFICAGGEAGQDTCTGDGGAPLICAIPDSSNRFYQVGAVAWGIECNEPLPAAYVNIGFFKDWIDIVMKQHGFEIDTYTPS